MDSPIRPFRQPRFSNTPGQSRSPDENRPTGDSNSSNFPRQLTSSPRKYQDRHVLLLLGNKVPSSVPGRRSSIACTRDKKALAPVVFVEEDRLDESSLSGTMEKAARQARSQSMKPLRACNRAGLAGTTREGAKTLRRL
jgi:hypothetical protein